MTDKPENPPAFPRPLSQDNAEISEIDTFRAQDGMTLRDYFAGELAKGMAGHLSEGDIIKIANGIKGGKHLVRASFVLADAMLSERRQGDKG
jgi:hypothetical protein